MDVLNLNSHLSFKPININNQSYDAFDLLIVNGVRQRVSAMTYADGPGTKLYNSSVSSMTWTMGKDPTVRGYKYAYNAYG